MWTLNTKDKFHSQQWSLIYFHNKRLGSRNPLIEKENEMVYLIENFPSSAKRGGGKNKRETDQPENFSRSFCYLSRMNIYESESTQ